MRAVALSLRHELIGLAGVVERNVYLTRRYIYWDLAFFVWTVANTLTIVFIAKGIEAGGGDIDVERATTTLLIGAVVWAYLGIIFEFLTETVAWERWEGTIEYTFMAPLSRAMHLGGSGVFAVLYGLVRAILLFIVVAAFFGLAFDDANFTAALVILIVASVSFFGIGMMTAVLPLISPEKGAQLGFVALALFGVGYLVGHREPSGSFEAERSLPMHATPAAPEGAIGSLAIGNKDAAGNWPMVVRVSNLKKLPPRGYYGVYLTRKGRPVAPCGTFVVSGTTTEVRLNVPYRLQRFDGWVITLQPPGVSNG